MPIDAVIVGCGRIAGGFNEASEADVLTHAVAFRRLGVRLAGCCDRDALRAAAFARRWSAGTHGPDLQRVLTEAKPQIVSLCTPPAERLALLEIILSCPSVRAVLVEKPLALTGTEARAIAKLAAAVPLLVNYQRAFDPFHLELERSTATNELGPLRTLTARYYGAAQATASHWLERVLALLGSQTQARRLGGTVESPIFEVCSSSASALFLPSEGCAHSPFELDLIFERGRVRVVDSERRAEWFRSVPDPQYPGYFTLAPVDASLQPGTESVLLSVQAAMSAASGQPVEWRALLARAVKVTELLDSLK